MLSEDHHGECFTLDMTRVNWELEPGEKVQEFVAALLLLAHPTGNMITPSRGDRGVDIRIPTETGYKIYQVKRYSSRLTSNQAKDIEASWKTFAAETLGHIPVASWTLVMPWNPTNERLEWLEALTSDAGIPVDWMGRITLDNMAADNPSLVSYYFGDGERRLNDLLASALAAGKEVPDGLGAAGVLDAVKNRQAALADSLCAVDPFYRYEISVRTGVLDDETCAAEGKAAVGAALVRFETLTDTSYAITRIYPRSAESQNLRPIKATVQFDFEPGTEEHDAVERFHLYGAPFEKIAASVISSEGPPGTTARGDGFMSVFSLPVADPLPELELKLLGGRGEVTHCIQLEDVQVSTGVAADRGTRLIASDRASVLGIEMLTGAQGRKDELSLTVSPPFGKSARAVLPAVEFLVALVPGCELQLAVSGGKALVAGWHVEDGRLSEGCATVLRGASVTC
jgi:hypothetical protein